MVAAAIVGGAVIGGVASNMAAGKAADAQENAANTASATSNAQFQQNRQDAMPWHDAGVAALGDLSKGTAAGGEFTHNFGLDDFVKDPGYQFRMDEGQRGVEAGAAARGGLLNGGTLKALTRYGQGFASNEYGNAYNRFNNDQTNRFNRLSSIAGIGQTATRDVANMGTQNAQYIGNNQMQAGNARASGYVGGANAIGNTVQTLGNWYMQRQYMNPSTTTAPAASTGSSMPWAGSDTYDFGNIG